MSINDGIIKAMIMREALTSCQMEGIGEDITLSDLYLEEIIKKLTKNPKIQRAIKGLSITTFVEGDTLTIKSKDTAEDIMEKERIMDEEIKGEKEE